MESQWLREALQDEAAYAKIMQAREAAYAPDSCEFCWEEAEYQWQGMALCPHHYEDSFREAGE